MGNKPGSSPSPQQRAPELGTAVSRQVSRQNSASGKNVKENESRYESYAIMAMVAGVSSLQESDYIPGPTQMVWMNSGYEEKDPLRTSSA